MKIYTRTVKRTAWMMLSVLTLELVFPNISLALTTGPSQPEVQGFEPVGTTDMVDMFSGDFVYNIPLIDVEGYPVNISYHGGVNMDQEASWVGLGWNINPGVINRTVRGIPDDFNGDSLSKDFSIKDETNLRIGVGANAEIAGLGDPFPLKLSASFGSNINISNYRGVSVDYAYGSNINVLHCVSAGVNIGVGSQSGASIDYNAGLSLSSSQMMSKDMAGGSGISAGVGSGYSTRSGLKDLSLSFSVSASDKQHTDIVGSSCMIPIGVKNHVPVITNSSTMNTIHGRIKVGFEVVAGYPHGNVSAMFNRVHFNNDASRSSFGYLYLQNANIDNSAILDFTRDKDGMFNKTMQYLPPPNMTYDIYSVSGQGTGGMFRPFRNDFGNVYDPVTLSSMLSSGGEAEAGVGNGFEAGLDYTHSGTEITSGPWNSYQRSGSATKGFTKNRPGSIYENVYFKQAGELTEVDSNYFESIGKKNLITPDYAMKLPQRKSGSDSKRDPRANLFYYHTAQEDTVTGVGTSKDIINYANSFSSTSISTPAVTKIKRVGHGRYQRKKDHISEITQVQKDGRKYVYNIPAINSIQKEVTFSVDPTTSDNPVDLGAGTVNFVASNISTANNKGRDHYYSSTITPSFTHSYLLTSVLSSDYVDVTGNGISDDDLGSYTKLNYSRTDSDYRWVAPYSSGLNKAQYNPGFWSDKLDDKGSVVYGSREQWYLHSIETKNFIAEFYTSPRGDGKGITTAILTSGGTGNAPFDATKSNPSLSYKLDSIKLYNKHDRFINGGNAQPIKTAFFVYDSSLCANAPNSNAGSGKLTLKKIYFRYGNSQKSMISPYQFSYGSNPQYDLAAKDRWGSYKPNNAAFTNYEFPYVDQTDPNNDTYAGAWSLTKIVLPSGGVIEAEYESDDYAFVQDKPTNEMFMVKGIGSSPAFRDGTELYANSNSPYLYLYFKRQPSKELSALSSFAKNYLGKDYVVGGNNLIYFNFNLSLTGANSTYEQIKGYMNVSDVGVCSNDASFGYLKIVPVEPAGGGATLNPVTYTALNTARYNLPQVMFPGSDPNESDLENILAGMKGSYDELISIGKSPITNMVKKFYGQNANLVKSYVRLQSVGLSKKGGGQRVKKLSFSDQWSDLSGGNAEDANYGKTYDYTIADPLYGKISSGVASYEPLIGGDENPLRQPIKYTTQSGSSFPPNDPVDLYQETPIGESLFPPASVGYSKISVKSIHSNVGRSSQGVDQYEFYTAKDFPAEVIATAIKSNTINHFDFFTQSNIYQATQGYTLIFNDMHGKPKKVEHDVYNASSQTLQPISYQIYNYRKKGNQLDNNVPCLVNVGSNMVVRSRQLGVEEDVTLDSRQKNEVTTNTTVNGNLNFFIAVFPIAIPLVYSWTNESQNEFQSAVVAKVVQQYGIIDNIVSYNEGAVTTVQNEVYDPKTGQVLVSSVNNEYQDREYNTTIPAYWVYKGMGSAYNNIGYKDNGTITIGAHHLGTLNISNTAPLVAGDELSVNYKDASGVQRHTTAWVMGVVPQYAVETLSHIETHLVYDTTITSVPDLRYRCCLNTDPINVNYYYTDTVYFAACWSSAVGGLGGTIRTKNLTGTIVLPDTCTFASVIQANISSMSAGYSEIPYSGGVCPVRAYSYVPVSSPNIALFIDLPTHTFTATASLSQLIGTSSDATVYMYDYFLSFPISGSFSCASTIADTLSYHNDTVITSHSVTGPVYTYILHPSCTGVNVLPRFPLNTLGWDVGSTLSDVSIEVINSGQKNLLDDNVENYTSMSSPINGWGLLSTNLTNLISLKARTFSDSNTVIPYNYIANADTINPFAIGERGLWRLFSDFSYLTPRNYSSVTARNSGLFNATSMFTPPTGLPGSCYLSPYNYWAPNMTDHNWHKTRTITKWSPEGKEVENIDAVGNYSTALYGFNQSLPVAVGANIKQGELLADGFEDYNLLQVTNNIIPYKYSPFSMFSFLPVGTSTYSQFYTWSSPGAFIYQDVAHTGTHSLFFPSGSAEYEYTLPVNDNNYSGVVNNYNIYYTNNPLNPYHFTSANEYLPFEVVPSKEYILSYWIKQSGSANITDYPLSPNCGVSVGTAFYPATKKTNIIEGWQLVEIKFTAALTGNIIKFPASSYVDDIRIYPSNGNMKSFVYNNFSEKLMATLDENNFAAIYEYDQEGNLIRVKKETPKGIMTISESRSGNPKHQ